MVLFILVPEDQKTISIELDVDFNEFMNKWQDQIHQYIDVDLQLKQLIEEKPAILDFSKWGVFLPIKHQIALLKQKYFDFENLSEITSLSFISND